MTYPDRREQSEKNELRRAIHNDTSIGWRGWLKHAVCALLAVALWGLFTLYVMGYLVSFWPYI